MCMLEASRERVQLVMLSFPFLGESWMSGYLSALQPEGFLQQVHSWKAPRQEMAGHLSQPLHQPSLLLKES